MRVPVCVGGSPTKGNPNEVAFRLWAPDALKAWYAPCGHPERIVALQESKQWPGTFDIQTSCRTGDEYAFLVQWEQEFRLRGPIAFYDGCFAEFEPKSTAPAPGADSGEPAQGEATGSPDDVAPAQAPESIDWNQFEFMFEVKELAGVISEADGVRLYLSTSAVEAQSVQVSSADGSWGPLPMRRSAEAAPEVQTWICDAPECGPSDEVVLKVVRRDWRIDPRSLVLKWGVTMPAGGSPTAEKQTPWLPRDLRLAGGGLARIRSVHHPLPHPQPSFRRCNDRDLILYEMHIGSFTPEGTLRAAAARLDHVKQLGATALSVMPLQQDALQLKGVRGWGYDPLSLYAVHSAYGTPDDVIHFVHEAHKHGLAVILDIVVNHFKEPAEVLLGPSFFSGQRTPWGPRPDFSSSEVQSYVLSAVALYCDRFGFDGVRVDSTKTIRKHCDGGMDAAGALLLAEVAAWCRRCCKLCIAEDLEDGEGVLQMGGLGFHFQWDMAYFCWLFEALVNPDDLFRNLEQVTKAMQGLAPTRGHALRGRIVFMESHDTAPSDRYGRLPSAIYNGKAFFTPNGDEGGDAFQRQGGTALPHPDVENVEACPFAEARATLGLVLLFTVPGVPMLLQGQELFECQPFKWPLGPSFDWARAAAKHGPSARVREVIMQLTALRLNGRNKNWHSPSPFGGDGLHVFHIHNGIVAYLRWPECGSDAAPGVADVGLVVANFSCETYSEYVVGVPPSQAWSVALSTASSPSPMPEVLQTAVGRPEHGFPCSVSVPLGPYSAIVLLRLRSEGLCQALQ
mmetsp:Transcript_17743/g.41288  ORF Transcript_17743/g.41288 Transcript_17743/m.41288 type:complete len:792 (+) Transcript_17743:69-2444(+)